MIVLHLLTSLKKAGIENLICMLCRVTMTSVDSRLIIVIINDVVDRQMVKYIEQTGSKVIELGRLPGRPWNILYYALKLRRCLRATKPDVVHVHNKLGFLLGFFASLFFRIRIVFTIHEMHLYSRSIFDRASKWLALKRADQFIAISQSVKEVFLNGTGESERIKVVYDGVDLTQFPLIHRLNEPYKIICCARLDHRIKGQDVLIEALYILKKRGLRFRCDFAGEGPSDEMLKRMIVELGLSTEEIRLLGVRNDVPELLADADLFVLPSRHEGFGMAIVEAMASGLPVIVSNIDGPAEIVVNGRDGLQFESGNAFDLADKINMLLGDDELRSRYSRASLLRARDFSIERMYEGYLEIYKSVILLKAATYEADTSRSMD